MIHVEGLCKSYRVRRRQSSHRAVLRSFFKRDAEPVDAIVDLHFNIKPGEMVGCMGPNGAGKSTMLKIMSGILVPDLGRCEIFGRVPWEQRQAHARDIGVVFGQRFQLWWDVPIDDSFSLLRDIYRIPPADYRRMRTRLVEALDLSSLLTTPLRNLSLGQRMRCELAASLLHQPRLLFLDEPTIGLDAVAKKAVRSFIGEMNQSLGTTVILTTHDMSDIKALTPRVLLLGRGRLLFDGTLSHLQETHQTTELDPLMIELYQEHGL